jgi:hypothetical protein
MPTKRRPLQLLPHDDELLRTLYREYNIPTDQYPQRPDDLARLVSTWNGFTGRNESTIDVLHYMVNKRKNGQWERLGRTASNGFAPQRLTFSAEELGQLDAIHEELQIASDSYALNPEAAKKLQEEFARRTGRIVPGTILAAAMIYRRKNGNLTRLKPTSDEQSLGFSDIDQVANA